MRYAVHFAALALVACCVAVAAPARAQNNFIFSMVPTGGDESCTPKATGQVTITALGGVVATAAVENMHVEFKGLPATSDFDLFVIQQPLPKFGLSWDMGDMQTDANGTAVGDFVGRFSAGTFIVAPGSVAAPVILSGDASSNPATAPVQLYHLGLWFDTPAEANSAGCGTTVTPFNSTHNAGVQVMNTSNFPALKGPLFHAP